MRGRSGRAGRRLRVALGLALIAGCVSPGSGGAPLKALSDGRYVMGTVLEITLYARDARAGQALLERLFARARGIERALTRFDPGSELSRLNARSGRGAQRVGPDLAELLAASQRYGRLTGGAFDPSVGALVALWWHAAERGRLPEPGELAAARARVGIEHLRADTAAGTAELLVSGVELDLGGIGKGYALDALVVELREAGVERALLAFGRSSIHAHGAPPGAAAWRVLLRGARADAEDVVALRDRALSVSGSLGQGFEIEGRRYGHVIDPVRGEPLTAHRVAAVIASSGAGAEALSTGLLVLGERDGMALLEELPEAEALLLDADGGRWQTAGWSAATSSRGQPEYAIR